MNALATENISIRLDRSLLNTINEFAKSRNISRSKAITIMLRSTHVTILPEGTALVKALFRIESLLSYSNITTFTENEIREVIKETWKSLDFIIDDTQQMTIE